MNDFICNQYNVQAAGKDDHVNANKLYDMAAAGGTGANDLESKAF